MSCTFFRNSPSLFSMPSWQDTYCRPFYTSSPSCYGTCPCSIPSRDGYDSSEDQFPCKYDGEFGFNIPLEYPPPYYRYINTDQRVATCEQEEILSPHSQAMYPLSNYSPNIYRAPPRNNMEIEPCPSSATGSGRRNLSMLLHKGYNFDKTQYLLLYTYSQLQGSSDDIIWIDESKGTFFINKPDSFAQKWGEYKGIDKMDYQKVSRSFRYYYKQNNLLKKVGGKLRQYQWDLEALKALKGNFNSGTPLKNVIKPIKKKTPNMHHSNSLLL